MSLFNLGGKAMGLFLIVLLGLALESYSKFNYFGPGYKCWSKNCDINKCSNETRHGKAVCSRDKNDGDTHVMTKCMTDCHENMKIDDDQNTCMRDFCKMGDNHMQFCRVPNEGKYITKEECDTVVYSGEVKYYSKAHCRGFVLSDWQIE